MINLSTGEASGRKNIYTNFKKTQFIKDRNCSVELNKEISVAEGDILAKESNLINTQAFKIMLIKSSNEELNLNKRYLFKFKTVSVKGLISKISKTSNEYIFECIVDVDYKINISEVNALYELSNLIVIDEGKNETIGFGYVLHNLDN